MLFLTHLKMSQEMGLLQLIFLKVCLNCLQFSGSWWLLSWRCWWKSCSLNRKLFDPWRIWSSAGELHRWGGIISSSPVHCRWPRLFGLCTAAATFPTGHPIRWRKLPVCWGDDGLTLGGSGRVLLICSKPSLLYRVTSADDAVYSEDRGWPWKVKGIVSFYL